MQDRSSQLSNLVAISNPRSGRNKRGGFENFKKVLLSYPEITHIISSSETDLIKALEQCKRDNTSIIVINGGDGTLLHVLTFLKKSENLSYVPCLVLLQAGTTSMAFGDVGCKGNLSKVIEKVVKFSKGEFQQLQKTNRQVLQMTLPDSNKIVCGMFFGAGVIYNGILYCRQNLHTKGMRGELGPSIAMIRYLLDWLTRNKLTTSTQANIKIDRSVKISGEFSVITATTLNRLLMSVYPFWGRGKKDNGISLTLIKKNAPKAYKAFLKILFGKPPNIEKKAEYYVSECPQVAALEIHDGFTLDGELFGEEGVVTKIVLQSAGCVTFLTI